MVSITCILSILCGYFTNGWEVEYREDDGAAITIGQQLYSSSKKLQILAISKIGMDPKLAKEYMPRLVELAKLDDYEVNYALFTQIAILGENAAPLFPFLSNKLKTSDSSSNRFAWLALSKLKRKGSPVGTQLIPLLNGSSGKDSDYRERLMIVLSEVVPDDPNYIIQLEEMTKDKSLSIRATAAGILTRRAKDVDVQKGKILLEALAADDCTIRENCLIYMSELPEFPEYFLKPLLHIAEKDNAPQVREQAFYVLRQATKNQIPVILPSHIERLDDPCVIFVSAVCSNLAKWGQAASPASDRLLHCIKNEEPFVRAAAAYALAKVNPKYLDKAVAVLIAEIDPTTTSGLYAMDCLGLIGPDAKAAIPAIRKISVGSGKFAQREAKRALNLIEK